MHRLPLKREPLVNVGGNRRESVKARASLLSRAPRMRPVGVNGGKTWHDLSALQIGAQNAIDAEAAKGDPAR